MSDLVGPEGSVVGMDLDGDVIEFAEQRRAAAGITNVEFQRSDALSVGSGRFFDAAVGRFVIMHTRDATEALRRIAERVRPGGIVAFHEWDARSGTAPAAHLPVLARFQALLARTFERSGARIDTGAELHWRMREAGLEPEPTAIAEVAVQTGGDDFAHRRWASYARSMLPKIVEYGLATEPDVRDLVDHRVRDELLAARDLVPLSWLMIGQWARKPAR